MQFVGGICSEGQLVSGEYLLIVLSEGSSLELLSCGTEPVLQVLHGFVAEMHANERNDREWVTEYTNIKLLRLRHPFE